MLNEQASGADPVYVHKPSLMGAAWQLCLRPDALEWQRGRYSGRIPYAGITRVRLSFRPASMQTRRFVTEIWWTGGRRLSIPSTSRRLPVEWYPQDRAYGAFIRELNRRIAAVGGPAAVVTGVLAFLYWPGLALFAAVALAIAALTVRALEIGDYAGAALLGGLFALFVWQSGIFFKRNRPGRYRPEAVPNDLVPQ
ncbi:MAG TPA: hypothetical protein VE801_07020 [Xanthobacteraceae bacterium]|nr:hypothetical protein [Xanthobacteraceae bacterium]